MSNFDFKKWLFENRSGIYQKAFLLREFNREDGYSDETENRDDMTEINPASLGVGQAEADREMQQQDDLNSDMVDNVSMGVAAETVGWANIEKSADNGLEAYSDKIKKHDFYYKMTTDARFDKGEQEVAELKRIYSQLSDDDKQRALDLYRDRASYYYPEKEYPLFAQRLKTYTTADFKGA